MSRWELLTLKDSARWSQLVDSCKQADIHFSPGYLKLFEDKIGGIPMLFISYDSNDKNFVLYPFFKRRINDIDTFSSLQNEFYDIVSPWYFGGPLFYSEINKKETVNSFLNNIQIFANENRIITEFTRIHPLLNVDEDFIMSTKAEYRYDVSYVDLRLSLEEIWSNFKKSNRNAINAAKRKKKIGRAHV